MDITMSTAITSQYIMGVPGRLLGGTNNLNRQGTRETGIKTATGWEKGGRRT
jgi:hypothetical protein